MKIIVLRVRLWLARLRRARLASMRLETSLMVAEIASVRESLESVSGQLAQALARCEEASRQAMRYEYALEEEREKNRVHESTIFTLVQANNMHLKRYEAESAIQIRRTVAAGVVSE